MLVFKRFKLCAEIGNVMLMSAKSNCIVFSIQAEKYKATNNRAKHMLEKVWCIMLSCFVVFLLPFVMIMVFLLMVNCAFCVV